MNAYQTEAAAALLKVMQELPQAYKLTYETRGIVGGAFNVTVTYRNDSTLSAGEKYVVEVGPVRRGE